MLRALIVLLILLALIWVLVLWRADRKEKQAEADFPPMGRILDVDGVAVHAEILGEGPDVVLIHGASGNTRDMTFRLAPALASDFRVIVLDRPGLGYTDRLDADGASIAEQADLLVRAAAQLGVDRPIVVGHSYGGAVALAWAVKHPHTLSALVPVSAPSQPWTSPLDPFYRLTSSQLGAALVVPAITAFASGSQVEAALRDVFLPQALPDGYGDHFGPPLSLRRPSLRENALQRASLLDEITALHPRLNEISVPTEIVHGSADTTVGLAIHSQKLVNQIAEARLSVLDGVGHMPHHVATNEVVAAIHRVAARAGLR